MRPLASRGDRALQACHARADDLLLAQPLTGKVEQRDGTIVLEGTREQPTAERLEVAGADIAKAEVRLDLPQVIRSSVLTIAILGKRRGGNTELEGEVGNGSGRSSRQVVGRKAHEPERDELDSEAQAVVIAAVGLHQLEVSIRESEERQQVGWWNIGREAVQAVSICIREEPDGHGRERRAAQDVSWPERRHELDKNCLVYDPNA